MLFGKPSAIGLSLALMALGTSAVARAQTYGLGKTPSAEESAAMGTTVDPLGRALPPGSGTAKDGAPIYARKCAACHGQEGAGTKAGPRLVGGVGTMKDPEPDRTLGSFWPSAVPIWTNIDRAMPVNQGGSLKPDEVYALTAYLLFKNGIVKDTEVMDAKSLPAVKMPNRDGFIPAKLEDINKQRCRVGVCP